MYTIWLDVDGELSSYFVSSSHQLTPLHKAAGRGHVSTVEYLIQEGADFNIKDNHGVSELEYTTDWGLRMLIKLWLSLVPRHWRGTGIQLMIVTKILSYDIVLKSLMSSSGGKASINYALNNALIQSTASQIAYSTALNCLQCTVEELQTILNSTTTCMLGYLSTAKPSS